MSAGANSSATMNSIVRPPLDFHRPANRLPPASELHTPYRLQVFPPAQSRPTRQMGRPDGVAMWCFRKADWHRRDEGF